MGSTGENSTAGAYDGWDSESSSDDEADGESANLKLETIEHVHFYDVWGVRIFKKEIMTGRL